MSEIVTSKTYCDRPGCGAEVKPYSENGTIRFAAYVGGEWHTYTNPSAQNTADLWRSCGCELYEYCYGNN